VNGFELHSKAFSNWRSPDVHLSASALTQWINTPDIFVAQRLLGYPSKFGHPAERGKAIEEGVVDVVYRGKTLDAAIADAEKTFDKTVALGTPASSKERAMIAPCITLATRELAQFGKPEFPSGGGQIPISLDCHCADFTIKFVGFLDFVYPQHGLIVDLKTSSKIMSVQSLDHQIQRCLYARANGNQRVRFLYVTPKKCEWREDGDVDEVLAFIKLATERLERFLRTSDDPNELAAIVPHNPSHYFWRGAEDTRRAVFGN